VFLHLKWATTRGDSLNRDRVGDSTVGAMDPASTKGKIRQLDDALASIADGSLLVVPADYGGVAMEATRGLIRRGVKRLRLVTLPTSSLQADLLIGAGSVEAIETSGVSFGDLGPAPRFTASVTDGSVRIKDATCPALHAALQAAEKAVPFMPLRGIIGSDVLAHRPDWKVIDNPFGENDPIVLLPAIRPDVALFHAPMADAAGNIWVGRRRELFTLAHAAAKTFATVEELFEGNLLEDAMRSGSTIPAFYVEAVAVAPRGAWPLALSERYPEDRPHLLEYLRAAATKEGFQKYLEQYVLSPRAG